MYVHTCIDTDRGVCTIKLAEITFLLIRTDSFNGKRIEPPRDQDHNTQLKNKKSDLLAMKRMWLFSLPSLEPEGGNVRISDPNVVCVLLFDFHAFF
jgi:hypothetical protein